ncbi:DNA repair exonuclease SbcCD ATPase subunit [Mycolicibacterium rutilum]|uniref:DNA repair exonuclease SbcCD ATPase subunit n=1 Tax=Mycolicibacterium rutilum TaxID=370526 RepID=A0A1H6K439_MYCRU|nr:AAA family ATPase [Mycolicibacterium rutilum]SEH70074.1 DNA repair exonuclease SbcCD ATPase subunit [Mycolicibacterium rutilum]
MKLHRMVLTNYRGITHREIEFPDHGVVVVSGANEIGKSSMIEALDLLLQAKDRSSKKEVKEVKPTHADVGAEVTAEISTGPYRFVYRKRFHKRCETELTVLAPHREQLTGDEAHERVLTMLDETVDTCLWQAQRVLQSSPTAVVDLSGCDALSRALDVAAGEAVTLSGAEPLIIDRVEEEYLRYFTRTGRATGEWAAANTRLRAAEEAVAEAAAAVAQVDEAVRRHAALTEELAEVAAQREAAAAALETASAAAEAVAAVRRQLKEAELVAVAAQANQDTSRAAVEERRRLRADIETRAAAIEELDAAAAAAAEEHATAAEVAEAAEAAAEQARKVLEDSQTRVEAARHTVQQLADRDEADRIAARLAKIDATDRDLARADGELATITLTADGMRAIETTSAAVDVAQGQVEFAAARLELIATADVEVRVGDETVTLAAGQTWSKNVSAATDIELPQLLTARLVPGTPASDMQAKLDAAQEALASELRRCGVADVVAARELDQRRRELVAQRDRLRATSEALTGDESADRLRARLAELTEAQPLAAELFGADADTARADLQAATAAQKQAIADCETHRKVAEAAGRRLTERQTQVTVLREKRAGATTELTQARERLEAQRAAVSDDELTVKAQAHADEAARASAVVTALSEELARTAPDAVAAALGEAQRRADALAVRHREKAEALRDVGTQLTVYGTEGRKGRLDEAETEREHALAEYGRVQRRARAAELLRSVLTRHRDATRMRYVEPFRGEVQRLGRLVFGESFEVEVDSSLRICSRTLAGRTVPYESLSGGAKEQLGIVARLASAALVAKEDSVPVVIDDALGFTDPDRLVKMGSVFNAVGGDGQVIVLTCSPQRYAAVDDAHHIELVG